MEELQQNRIKREPDGCYMVTDLAEELSEEDIFVSRMITENRIRSLLIPRLRNFNGRQSLYYEITGLQTLEARSRISPLNAAGVLGLLSALLSLAELLPDYCLKAEDLLLTFDKIFTDGKELYFIYCCGQKRERSKEEGINAFAKELIGAIDHDDQLAVVYAYQFYKAAGQGQEGLKQLLERFMQGAQGTDEQEDKTDEEAKGEEREDLKGAEKREASDAEGEKKDPIALISFGLLFVLGVFLLIWKSRHIEPFSPVMLISGQEGIAGLCFTGVGAGGFFFSFFHKRG